MKRSYSILIIALGTLLTTSCIEMMRDVKDVERVVPITVSFKVSAVTGFVPKSGELTPDPNFSTEGVNVTLTNNNTSQVYKNTTNSNSIATFEIDPGVYSVGVAGTAEYEGSEYYLNGNISSISLFTDVSPEEAETNSDYNMIVRPAKVGSLCFSEIYYCGVESYYFRDQTYQIYNNGDEVEYLDGVVFAQLYPETATSTLPTWPDEDGTDNYIYSSFMWQFPGDGTDYPLQPGESVVIAQEARDHTVNNENSYDNSMAEWECWTGNADRQNDDVPDLPYIFYTGSLNTLQWLTSVFGSAFALVRPDDGTIINAEYYEDTDHLQHVEGKTTNYAKIPAAWVLDGVELITNMSSLDMKRIPGFVDSGATSVEESYCGKSVSRKVLSTRPDGTPIYQDTNNSTEDFQVNDHPAIRRNGEGVPSWSPSLK